MAAVLMYAIFACVALLSLSLINSQRRRRGATWTALALLVVSLCAVAAIIGVRWLLQHNPPIYWGAHYTPALAQRIRQAWANALRAAAGHFYAVGAAFVIGVCATAAHLILAARRPPSPAFEHTA
jgi:hypothetical protein